MFIYILLFVLIAIAALLFAASRQPDLFRVERSGVFHAAPETVFAYINDLHLWNEWSPWAKLDPRAKNTFEGPSAGLGAFMSWDGNSKVGAGSMTILESEPYTHIKMTLKFLRPMKATNTTEFVLKQDGEQTIVTWSMYGPNSFAGKLISLIMNCDKMVGTQFEHGFANLKMIVDGGTIK